MEKSYKGIIKLAKEYDAYCSPEDILFIIDPNTPESQWNVPENTLASKIHADMLKYGSYLSIQYWVSNKPITTSKLKIMALDWLEGLGNAEYGVAWSETSGYLWTNEKLQVGGHDLLQELKTRQGKYIILKIKFSKEQPKPKVYHQNI